MVLVLFPVRNGAIREHSLTIRGTWIHGAEGVGAVMIMNCQPIIPSKMKVTILHASYSSWLEASRVTSEALSLDLDHDPADPICDCAHLSPGTTEYSQSY